MAEGWLTRRQVAGSVLSGMVLAACGIGVGFAPIRVSEGAPGWPVRLPGDVSIAAIVASDGPAFVLDRAGSILRLDADGSLAATTALAPYMTPFGALVGGRAVFGGLRCEGGGCRTRVGEVVTLDGEGRVASVTAVVSSERRPSRVNGLALVGVDGSTVWVNTSEALVQVEPGGGIGAEVPWPGGEPCLVDGVLHDLSASGGTGGPQGEELPSDTTFRLRLRAWDGAAWRPVAGGEARMAHGRNAYCAPGGYEIRDGRSTVARWTPGTGWRRLPPRRPAAGAAGVGAVAPVASGTGRRYVPAADGTLLDVTGAPRPTAVELPGLAASEMAPAIQVDDAGSALVACATTYRRGQGTTHCVRAPEATAGTGGRTAARRSPVPAAATALRLLAGPESQGEPDRVHHYNMCSAACGAGPRAHSRDVVAWLVAQRRPAALSLNEACYDDGVQLAARWPEGFGAGTAYVALSRATNCPGVVKRMGNQVVVASTDPDPPGAWAPLPTQAGTPCRSLLHECRGLACADARPPGEDGPLTVCTAHLEPPRGDPAATEAQAREYLRVVVERSRPGVPTVVAGDFNLARSTVDRWFADAGFAATPVGSTMVGRDGEADEIDVIYQEPSNSSPPLPGGRYCDRQASDHCYLRMTGPARGRADR